MNRLSTEQRARIVGCLVEGMSVRATVRLTGAAKNTVTKLLVEIGAACAEYQDGVMQGLKCREIQCDEIWSFVGAKHKNVPAERQGEWGDAWTWVAIDADSKLVPCWAIGGRTVTDAVWFMRDLASRLAHRVQLTTDGYKPYLRAVDESFGQEVDYAVLIKLYGNDPKEPQRRYSPEPASGRSAASSRVIPTGRRSQPASSRDRTSR